MKQRLDTIRENAMNVRECLSECLADHQDFIFKLDRIIRGTVFVKWLHRIAGIFFILFGAFFIALLYPSVKAMLIMLGISIVGYIFSMASILIQLKFYERTIFKIESQTLREVTFCDHNG